MPKISKPIHVIGVDPGASGGIALISGGKLSFYSNMPTLDIDLFTLIEGISRGISPVVYIEQVNAMPGQGVVSMFKFGMNYGKVLQAFCRLPRELIRPIVWQRGLSIPVKDKGESKPQYKDRLRVKALQLYPDTILASKGLGYQRSVCDAILIATYGYRKEKGIL